MNRLHDFTKRRWKLPIRTSALGSVIGTVVVLALLGCQDTQDAPSDDIAACVSCSTMADLNLTYIGEAIGPNETLTYYMQGPAHGETVVLIPGMGRGVSDYRDLSAALNNVGYRTVAIQPRGIDRSGPIVTDPTYDQFADDVALVLSDIPGGIPGGRVHVIGYEYGNRIARMYAVRYPESVSSLVLLACGGHAISTTSSPTDGTDTTQSGAGATGSVSRGQMHGSSTEMVSSPAAPAVIPLDVTAKIDSFFFAYTQDAVETDSQDVTLSGFIATFAYWLPPYAREPYVKQAFFASMSQVPNYWITGWYRDSAWMQIRTDHEYASSEDWVGGGNAPMLILQGEYDVAAPVENATSMKEAYPERVTLFVVPDAGHAMLAEQPEFIAEHVISYLDQHPIVR